MARHRCILTVIAIAALALIGLPDAARAEREETNVTVAAMTRPIIVHWPDTAPPEDGFPVLIAFHPALGTGQQMEETTRLHQTGPGQRMIVVYPDGYRRTWNAGPCCGLARDRNIDDVAFFKAIVAALGQRAALSGKVFVTGYSNGAMFVYHLVCMVPELVTAAAPFAATRDMSACKSAPPVPLLHIHGDTDASSPVEGGTAQSERFKDRLGYMQPARASALAVARRNGCAASSEPDARWRDALGTVCESWTRGCRNASAVSLCVVPGLGHTWPGAPQGQGFLARKFGPARPDLKGSEAIAEFFAGFAD